MSQVYKFYTLGSGFVNETTIIAKYISYKFDGKLPFESMKTRHAPDDKVHVIMESINFYVHQHFPSAYKRHRTDVVPAARFCRNNV